MVLEQLVHQVGAKVLNFGRAMIQADAASDRSEELEHLRAEYARDDDQLATLRGQSALLAQQISENEESIAQYPGRIESSMHRGKSAQALRQALELERLRQDLAAARVERSRLEHAVWCLEFRLRQLQRRMDRLREELAS